VGSLIPRARDGAAVDQQGKAGEEMWRKNEKWCQVDFSRWVPASPRTGKINLAPFFSS